MKHQRKAPWIVLLSLALFIKIFSLFPNLVEQYYSRGVYPYIAKFQRLLLGWIPFSVGDILYFFAGLYLVRVLVVVIRNLIRKQINKQAVVSFFREAVLIILSIYVVFNLSWGLNYNRIPMAQRFGLNTTTYSTPELYKLVQLLGDTLNALDSAGITDDTVLSTKRSLFDEAVNTYQIVGQQYPDLFYQPRSVKPSLYSYLGNYLGFSGYYNPFSGEAQVNTTIPAFVQPFVTCHEIGHQLGYAKEDEANFSSFLSARCSPSDAFLYSIYFDMYSYARRELYLRDSIQMKALYKQLRPRVRRDFTTIREFYKKYENPFEPLITKLYAQYLKANQQPQGMMSYNEVVAMLISYYINEGAIEQERSEIKGSADSTRQAGEAYPD
ncbi:MAG: DUF3810 domain-containing protein [Chitinophagaceae bacterium]|nr:DUF3810 domain-containing protein [Chitinophagaceae bacterium]